MRKLRFGTAAGFWAKTKSPATSMTADTAK